MEREGAGMNGIIAWLGYRCLPSDGRQRQQRTGCTDLFGTWNTEGYLAPATAVDRLDRRMDGQIAITDRGREPGCSNCEHVRVRWATAAVRHLGTEDNADRADALIGRMKVEGDGRAPCLEISDVEPESDPRVEVG